MAITIDNAPEGYRNGYLITVRAQYLNFEGTVSDVIRIVFGSEEEGRLYAQETYVPRMLTEKYIEPFNLSPDHITYTVESVWVSDKIFEQGKDQYKSLWLLSYPQATYGGDWGKIDTIKAIRELMHNGLKEAKDMSEALPVNLGPVPESNETIKRMRLAGCQFERR